MEKNNGLEANGQDIFSRYGDQIDEACKRAVREALLKHKLAGNPVAVSRDGNVVLLQPDEIEVD
jgi:phosphopantothenate synthetase